MVLKGQKQRQVEGFEHRLVLEVAQHLGGTCNSLLHRLLYPLIPFKSLYFTICHTT